VHVGELPASDWTADLITGVTNDEIGASLDNNNNRLLLLFFGQLKAPLSLVARN
jgi:hypothetical protein